MGGVLLGVRGRDRFNSPNVRRLFYALIHKIQSYPPGDPTVLQAAVGRMIGRPVYLSPEEQATAFGALCRACEEFGYALRAVSIESWHAHWLIDAGYDDVSRMIGRLKTRMRQAVGRGRIWTAGFDKRFCFDHDSLQARQDYIARHHGHRPL